MLNDFSFVDSLFMGNDISLEDMKKGLTNTNYLLHIDNSDYVLRVPRFDSEQIVNRHHETLALQAIKDCDIDVETLYYDENSGYKVTRYLPDAFSYEECPYLDKIERCAELMRRFHSLHKKVKADFDPISRFHQYNSYIKHPIFDLSPFTYLLDDVASLHNEKILCHNDWVSGNILYTKEKTYLIDFEYAANNDPLFDVMSFLTENQIEDELLRERFYQVYFDDISESNREQLSLWERFHNLLWCAWAMMMYDTRKEEVYRNIAHDKYQALLRSCEKHKERHE